MNARPAPHELVGRFKAVTLGHPHLIRADAQLRARIAQPAGAALAVVCGPTGVGKTTLVERVMRVTNESESVALIGDPLRFGVVYVRAMAPEARQFSWRDLYYSLLVELCDVFRDRPVVGHPTPGELHDMRRRRATISDVRTRLVKVLRLRRPPAVIVDEAHHIGLGLAPSEIVRQMEVLKSVADEAGVFFVTVGTYDLARLRNLNGQLSRRSHDIHLPRYRVESDEELAIFNEVARELVDRLPLGAPSLPKHLEAIYARTLGCVGNLKDWLTLALSAALEEGSARIEWRHMVDTQKPSQAVIQMANEIASGEWVYRDSDLGLNDIRRLLGAPQPAKQAPKLVHPKSSLKPGERRPTRDPAGPNALAEALGGA